MTLISAILAAAVFPAADYGSVSGALAAAQAAGGGRVEVAAAASEDALSVPEGVELALLSGRLDVAGTLAVDGTLSVKEGGCLAAGSVTGSGAISSEVELAPPLDMSWRGTFTVDWAYVKAVSGVNFDFNSLGNSNSLVVVAKDWCGSVGKASLQVHPAVRLDASMTFTDGVSSSVTSFRTLAGSGDLNLTKASRLGYSYSIEALKDYTGTITVANPYSSSATAGKTTLEIGSVELSSRPADLLATRLSVGDRASVCGPDGSSAVPATVGLKRRTASVTPNGIYLDRIQPVTVIVK